MLYLDPCHDHWIDDTGVLHSRDPHSALGAALGAHIEVTGRGEDRVARLGKVVLGRWEGIGWAVQTRLTPLELRFLADRGRPHPTVQHVSPLTPRTDLHTHFAGCVSGADLVGIGADADVVYPQPLLQLAGISASADLPLGEAREDVRAALALALALPLDTPCTHQDMKRVYTLRRPLTKHRPAFAALCTQIAKDYARMGVCYAELSLFDILDPAILAIAHDTLPALREQTGVDLRFLAALSRHDDLEWDLDMVRRLEAYADSSLIVGVDFMGHETNSTRAFVAHLQAVAQFARAHRPDFVIRVHAGENPMFPENVPVAVRTLADTGVSMRVGHGLYGVDDSTLASMVAGGVVVEFNLDSNFALNNVRDALHAPLARYVDAGVAVVLGTDGYGIYHGDARHQARLAALSGLTDLRGIRATEDAILARRSAADDSMTTAFSVPLRALDPLHFTEEVARRLAAEKAADAHALTAAIDRMNVPLVSRADIDLGHGDLVGIAGSWRHSWATLDAAQQQRIRSLVDGLVARLARRQATLLTGGTRHGVEGCVHEAARRHGVTVVGTVVDATPAADLDRVDRFYRVGRTLYDKAPGLYRLLAEHDGFACFIGGGNIVNDEIRVAQNLHLRRGFLRDIPGASGHGARRWPDHGFGDVGELFALMDGNANLDPSAALWFEGPNPTADLICTRGGGVEVLLIQRRVELPTAGGRWALPGGFVREGETAEDAAVRVLESETGVDLGWMRDSLFGLETFQGGGRDPRDTTTRWTVSHPFHVELPANVAALTLIAGDDAGRTRWFPTDGLPVLAFDHAEILAVTLGPR